MKRKRTMPHPTRLLRRILLVIAFVLALAAGCTVWAATCAEPKELQFPAEFAAALQKDRSDPAKVAWLLFDEASRQLNWYGTSSLYSLHFRENCNESHCIIESMSMTVEIAHNPNCSWAKSRFNHSFALITIEDFNTLEIESELHLIRWGFGAYEPSFVSFAAVVDWVRQLARQTIGDHEWQRNPVIQLVYFSPLEKWQGKHWDVSIRSASGSLATSIDILHPHRWQALRGQSR